MNNFKLIAIITYILISSFVCSSQVEIRNYIISNNDTCLRCVLGSEYDRTITYFFPTSKINRLEFEKRTSQLVSDLKTITDSILVQFVYYKENVKSDAKGMKLISAKDTILINYFNCFIKGIDSNLLYHSKSKMVLNFEIKNLNQSDNLFDVQINDSNVCIELLNKLSYFNDFIIETLNPKYSELEQIYILQKDLIESNNQNRICYERINKLNKEIKKIEENLNLLKNDLETLKEKNQKPNKEKKQND